MSRSGNSRDADVIVVGAGHNGLIGAAYLARAGIDTLLLEARDEVGGCASTVSDLGARFNICNCDHTMIRAMPISDELDLEPHGLTYLEADASFINLFHDNAEPWAFFHEAERTVDGLAAAYPRQVDGYRRYLADALPVAELIIEMARTTPTTPRLAGRALGRRIRAAARLMAWSRRSVADVMADYFDDWHVTMPAISTGPTVWGVPPELPRTGLGAATFAIRHLVRTGRPRGGSGALTDSIRRSFEAGGGRVRCDARVRGLVVDDGRVAGVRLDDDSALRARAIVAACDPARVFVDWVGDPPPAAKRVARRWRQRPAGDGYESKIDAVLDALPRYTAADRLEERHAGFDTLGPTVVVSPSPEQLALAHSRRHEGLVADEPTLLVNVPSVLDPTLQPEPGRHVLSLEALYTPYALPGGWPQSKEPQRWLDVWSKLLEPGGLDGIGAWRVMTPDRYEAEFSMHRGHTPSYAGSPLAALFGRQRELTRYRTPIGGLYLSGAGTYPGAGIFGASGRNVAAVVRRDLDRSSLGVRRLVSLARSHI